MSEETNKAEGGQALPTPPTPQAGQTTTETQAQAAKASLSADAYEAELKKVRDEAAKSRIERKELAAKLAEYDAKFKAEEDAKLTEQERITKEAKALAAKVAEYETRIAENETRSRALALRNAILEHAPKAGIARPDMAAKLLDTDKLELDDNGTPKNLDVVLKDLIKEYPELRGVSQTSATNPSRSDSSAGASEEAREAYIRSKVYGQPKSIFDVSRARSEGGGVVVRDDQ